MAGDDTDFPEFDPTPYDGGYDAESVYGKSTAPSEKSCYPPHRDGDDNTDLSSLRNGDDDNLSVISAYGVELPDDLYKPPEMAKPKPANPPTAQPEISSNNNHAAGVELPDDLYKPPEMAKPKPANPPTPQPEISSNNNHAANDESTGQQEPQSSNGQWVPDFDPPYFNYNAPMNYYSCDLFSLPQEKQEEEPGSSYEPTEDISEKVARWLFSSTYI